MHPILYLFQAMKKVVCLLRECCVMALFAVVWLVCVCDLYAVPSPNLQHLQRRDTIVRRELMPETPAIRSRMMSSSLPVDIKQQGRYLCVTSRYSQLLPVYRTNGTLYTAFRITKGTNWLSGLPMGAYYINTRRFTIN